jgi:ribosomal protein L34E
VAKPWLTGRVTPAVLARKVHGERPTLLLDETDATFAGDPEFGQVLRGLLNSGYRRGGKSSVCVGQGANISYVDLDTFAPKALAGLGELPDTVASRSIRIVLKRKAPSENVERFRRREANCDGGAVAAVGSRLGRAIRRRARERDPGTSRRSSRPCGGFVGAPLCNR